VQVLREGAMIMDEYLIDGRKEGTSEKGRRHPDEST
jgi:hypothetical protein